MTNTKKKSRKTNSILIKLKRLTKKIVITWSKLSHMEENLRSSTIVETLTSHEEKWENGIDNES